MGRTTSEMHTYIALCLDCGTIMSEVRGIQTNAGPDWNYSPATQEMKRDKETTRPSIHVFIRQSSVSIITTIAVRMPSSIDFMHGNTSLSEAEGVTTRKDHSKANLSLVSSSS